MKYTMTLDCLADYYCLQAVVAHPQASRHPDLVRQADTLLTRIAQPIADCFFDYMFLASMGEARHANKCAGGYYYTEIPPSKERDAVYKLAPKFEPIDALTKLVDLFGLGSWGGSYGGKKWQAIAQTALRYRTGEIPARLFIDAVADLKHNGGNQFSKTSVQYVIPFQLTWSSDYHSISTFLDLKRDAGSLLSVVDRSYFNSLSLEVGRVVLAFMQRVGLKTPNWSVRGNLAYTPLIYGTDQLTDRVDNAKPASSKSSSSSSPKNDSLYLSEDEMYDPDEAASDPKVPKATQPAKTSSPFDPKAGELKPDEQATEIKPNVYMTVEEAAKMVNPNLAQEAQHDGTFSDWLVSASATLPHGEH